MSSFNSIEDGKQASKSDCIQLLLVRRCSSIESLTGGKDEVGICPAVRYGGS